MVVFFKWWFRRRQRILASRRGKGDVEKATPLGKLAAVLHLKNKGGSSTGSSSSGIQFGKTSMTLLSKQHVPCMQTAISLACATYM